MEISDPGLKTTGKEPSMSGDEVPHRSSDSRSPRRFPRYPIDLHVSIHVLRRGEGTSMWGRSNELGEDGIGATLTGTLETGEIVTLEIPLPLSAYPLKVRAIVRYGQGLHYGFEFLTLNDIQRDTIRRVCQMLATKA
jgi:hypothetical protein